MMAKQTSSEVVAISSRSMPKPRPAPKSLDKTGAHLWTEVVSCYEFADPGSYAILEQACLCVQRAERCRLLIDKDGEMLFGKNGPRANPLLRDELGNRALCARLLGRLGLDLEPLHPTPGRPSGR
jgi:hypothetical protein